MPELLQRKPTDSDQLYDVLRACGRKVYVIKRHETRRGRLFVGVLVIVNGHIMDVTGMVGRVLRSQHPTAIANRREITESLVGGETVELKSNTVEGILELGRGIGAAIYDSTDAVECEWLS